MSGPRSYHNPEKQSISLCPAFPSKAVRIAWPYQYRGRHPHSNCLFTSRNKAEPRQNRNSYCCLFFQKMDLNKDGVVTLEEFLDSCMSDEDISQSMAVFDSAIWRTPVRGNPPPSWSWRMYWAVRTSKDCEKNGKRGDVNLQGWLIALISGLQPLTAKYADPASLSEVLEVIQTERPLPWKKCTWWYCR
jgi:hypothetical protein